MTEAEEFVPWDWPSPLLDRLGDLRSHPTRSDMFGFVVDQPKLNARGLLHAGAICTIADVCLGHSLATSTEPPMPLVTVALNTNFLGTARIGQWVDVIVVVSRVGQRVAAGRATLLVDERVIAEVSGLFVPSHQGGDRAAMLAADRP